MTSTRTSAPHAAGLADHDSLPGGQVLREAVAGALARLGVAVPDGGEDRPSPVTGETVSRVAGVADEAAADAVAAAVGRAKEAFTAWREVPAPARGAVVRRFGDLLAEHLDDLALLVGAEVGKIGSEARGEIQEMVDICDFAVGLSRQLYGRTMPSERPGHRLMETWHPLGVVGVISAFNFPAAVWSWNTAIALVCGDTVVWKPSELTPLVSVGAHALLVRALADAGAPDGVSQLVLGDGAAGTALVDHPDVALVSATGSTRMGREVGPRVARRFGRSLLELGGNNAAVVAPSADLDLTVRGVVFSAAGTAGQRCTTLRRVLAHRSVVDELTDRVAAAYRRLPVGNPFAEQTLVGPLIHGGAFAAMQDALGRHRDEGSQVVCGGEREREEEAPDAYYVRPALVRAEGQTAVTREETFAPVLTVMPYDDLDEALALHNDVAHGLSSSIFTQDQAEAERFLVGSDCGIVNVNIGTSGAEIGGAFGGEKETGGGRESGSDAWRAYMRRATNTVNYSGALPLAQGVRFEV